MKRPSILFYPGDWLKDPAVQSCSFAAQGFWMNMMCNMHQCEPYGYLVINGEAPNIEDLSNLFGKPKKVIKSLLAELKRKEVFSITEEGWIYSRRMVRDEALRHLQAEGGKAGKAYGQLGAEHGSKGGRPKKDKGGFTDQQKTPLPHNQKPPSSSSISSSFSLSSSEKKDLDKGEFIVNHNSYDDDFTPLDEAQWGGYFYAQHGIKSDEKSRAWPIFTSWCKAGFTIGQVNEAVRLAQEKAPETISFLPAYINRILLSQTQFPPAKPRTKQTLLESQNAQSANAWLAEIESKNADE